MPLDQAAISRLHHTALRASHTTLATFEQLLSSVDLDRARASVFGFDTRLGCHSRHDVEHARVLATIVTEISSTATLICKDLALLCEVALAGGGLTSEVHRVLSHVLMPAISESKPIDIRTARLMRLPPQQAIDIVASGLDEMCDQIDALLVVLRHQQADQSISTHDDGNHHERRA